MNKVSFSKTLFVQHFCISDKPKKIPKVDFWRGGWFMKWLDGYYRDWETRSKGNKFMGKGKGEGEGGRG